MEVNYLNELVKYNEMATIFSFFLFLSVFLTLFNLFTRHGPPPLSPGRVAEEKKSFNWKRKFWLYIEYYIFDWWQLHCFKPNKCELLFDCNIVWEISNLFLDRLIDIQLDWKPFRNFPNLFKSFVGRIVQIRRHHFMELLIAGTFKCIICWFFHNSNENIRLN